ncbi:MAG: peptidase M15 [Coxiellaceae bacterium]|nr:MAG: peptidase M15 [Coxiellaceae bacterium]
METTHIPLIDVVRLSEKRCRQPIRAELKYATAENFIGRPIAGYALEAKDICLMGPKAAHAMCDAQNWLVEKYNYSLIIYDAYRPLRAVQDFAQWFHQPSAGPHEMARAKLHYPHLTKDRLPELGYVAPKVSRHCFGNAVDVCLIDLATESPLDMGAIYDYFDDISHTTATANQIGEAALRHREILAQAMLQVGFEAYKNEYWHFNFYEYEVDEPLDVPITTALKGVGVK